MASNPLSTTGANKAPAQHPQLAHAQVWKRVTSMSPSDQEDSVANATYALPILGQLAGDPNVNRKDVIKAAADAAGSGKMAPSQAVHIISEMPDDPDKLQPWLKSLYAFTMSATIHAKAEIINRQNAQAAPVPQTAPQAAPQPMAPQGAPQ